MAITANFYGPKDYNPHTRMPNFKLTDEQAKQIHKAQVRRKVFVNDRDRKSLTCYSVEDVENLVAR